MQKEKLSALMDGETLDNELLNELSRSSEMQKTWESYHLIRDTLRGDTAEVLQFDISARVMARTGAGGGGGWRSVIIAGPGVSRWS